MKKRLVSLMLAGLLTLSLTCLRPDRRAIPPLPAAMGMPLPPARLCLSAAMCWRMAATLILAWTNSPNW